MDKDKLVAELIASGKFDTNKEAVEKLVDDLLKVKSDVSEVRDFLLGKSESVDKGKKPAKDPDEEDDDLEDGKDQKKKKPKAAEDEDDDSAEEDAEKAKKKKPKDVDVDGDDKSAKGANSQESLDVLVSKGCGHKYDASNDMIAMAMSGHITRGTYGDVVEMSKSVAESTDEQRNSDFRPTPEELKQIHAYSKKDYPKEAFKVFYTKSADNDVDRHAERFSLRALKDMAKFSPGNPVMKDHNYGSSDGVFGKIFDAKVMKDADDAPYLAQKFYVLDTPENKSAIDGFESGINDKLSVGVAMKREDYLCDICNKAMFGKSGDYGDWCGHMPGAATKDGKIATATINRVSDYRELSRVTVPAQRKAQVKSILRDPENEFDVLQALPKDQKEKLASALNAEVSDPGKFVEVFTAAVQKGIEDGLSESADGKSKLDAGQTKEGKPVDEELKKLFMEQFESNKSLTAKISSLVEISEKQETKNADWKKSVEAQLEATKLANENLRKQSEERGEALKILIGAVATLTEKIGVAVSKSTTDVAREVATQKSMDMSRTDAERNKAAGANADHGADYYTSFNASVLKAAEELNK